MNKSKACLLILMFELLSCASSPKKIPGDKLKSPGDEAPALITPEVRRMWVPDKIEGDQYVKGHFIYYFEKGAQWKLQ